MTPDTRPGKLKTIADTRAWVRAFFDGAATGRISNGWPPRLASHSRK
ncbi:MAG: hypothetical protein ACRD82_11075 [Blastocatellia bacterium]